MSAVRPALDKIASWCGGAAGNKSTGSSAAGREASALEAMRPSLAVGSAIAAGFFVGLGGWAALAPLDSAAIAAGVVGVESRRKTIQHLEGGIVTEILVRDGDVVNAGQPLVRLDPTQAGATLERLRTRWAAAKAQEERLTAERDSRSELHAPAVGASPDRAAHAKLLEALAGEASLLRARRDTHEQQKAILGQRIAQYEQEIAGLEGQIEAETTQLGLIADELSGQRKLRKKKLIGKQRLLELQREQATLKGNRARHRAAIARAGQNIAEERLKILDLDTRRVADAVTELRNTQTTVLDLEERLMAAADILERTEVHAPQAGIVVNLQVHTVGGVVAPGQGLMDIVPSGETLIVEARVKPEDIDSVHPGLEAQVALTAFSRRNVPPVEGEVLTVSADRLTDDRTGEAYFLARVAIDNLPYGPESALELYPGMQAEVMIVTGSRTTLGYLFSPLSQSFNRAFREE